VKALNVRITRCARQLDMVLRDVMMSLRVNQILPFYIFHVEHCVDCEDHQKTTRHEPGSFEKAFDNFRDSFRKKLPPALIYGNSSKICPAALPFRMGTFEILLRDYNSTQTRFVYSKLQSDLFPDCDDLAAELTPAMLPEVRKFDKESTAMLEVLAFDACIQKTIGGAEVSVYLVTVTVNNTEEDIEGIG
jgi:hypothetical protein